MTARTVLNKVAPLALLLAAMVLPHPELSRVRIALLAFGAFNVLVPAPGALLVRVISTMYTLGALVAPDEIAGGMLIIGLFFWPPLFMVAWAFSPERAEAAGSAVELEENFRGGRRTIVAIIAAAAVASLAYRLISRHGLDQTSALFVGLPALLAIVVVMAVAPRTAVGVATKATSVGLLLSLVSLQEGWLCIVVTAPIFYAIAIGIAGAMDVARSGGDDTTRMASILIVLISGSMSLEGVTPATSFRRDETVIASKVVHAPTDSIARAVFEPPRFVRGRPRPLVLRMGFPTPATSRIERTPDRTRWTIEMRGGEMLLNGMEAKTGDLVMDLEESRSGFVRWRAVSDSSHMTHFLRFRESIVQWETIDATTTRVTWTIRYDRGLDPWWYFGPMERYATRLAAGYLIDAVATP